MPRPLILFVVFGLCSANLYGEEFDPKSLPAVKRAMDKATAEVARNRKAYGEANEKVLREVRETISNEVERLSKAGKLEEAVAVKKFAETVGEQVVAKAEKRFAPPNPAQDGALAWKGHKYKVFQEPCSWHDAKKRCEDIGGHLVILDDQEEQNFVWRSLTSMPDGPGEIWLGVTLDGTARQWVTVNGAPLKFTKWGPTEPYGDGSFVLMWVKSDGGFWNDYSADHRIPFVCEWDD